MLHHLQCAMAGDRLDLVAAAPSFRECAAGAMAQPMKMQCAQARGVERAAELLAKGCLLQRPIKSPYMVP